jgi:hypothetical protein
MVLLGEDLGPTLGEPAGYQEAKPEPEHMFNHFDLPLDAEPKPTML